MHATHHTQNVQTICSLIQQLIVRYHIAMTGMNENESQNITSSSAVAEKPRDASLASLVQIRQKSIISYFGFRFTAAHK